MKHFKFINLLPRQTNLSLYFLNQQMTLNYIFLKNCSSFINSICKSKNTLAKILSTESDTSLITKSENTLLQLLKMVGISNYFIILNEFMALEKVSDIRVICSPVSTLVK